MKKLAALLTACMIIMILSVAVAAEGIYVRSESGDKIRILENAVISEPIQGNAVLVLGDVTVNSRVGGHVITVFGDAYINSEVSGQVVSLFGNTVLQDNAQVMGDVITIGSLTKADSALIGGQEVRVLGESMNLDIGALSYLRLITVLLFTLAVLITGMLALLISRKKYNSIAKRLDRNFSRKFILGILAFTGASALLLLLLMTLIAPLFYIILLLLSSIPAFMYLGRKILKSFSPKNSIFTEFITGLVTVTLVKLIIIFLIPQQSILLSAIIIGIMDIFIYSIGLGILVEQYYLKNNSRENHKADRAGSGSDKPASEGEIPEQKDGTEDRRTGKVDRRSGTEDRRTGTEDRRSGIEDRRTENSTGVQETEDRRTGAEDRRSGTEERRTGTEDRRSGTEDRRAGNSTEEQETETEE